MSISSLIWLRRDLRLSDNISFNNALKGPGHVQPIFIFDPRILADFPNKCDARVSFIADALVNLDKQLNVKGGELLVFYGNPEIIIPKLAKILNASHLFAGTDYEPDNINRDETVRQALKNEQIQFSLSSDHTIINPQEITKDNGSPYLVFTPYLKKWYQILNPMHYANYSTDDKGRYTTIENIVGLAAQNNLNLITLRHGAKACVEQIGYNYNPSPFWPVTEGKKRLKYFITNILANYNESRNYLSLDGTSKLSPYIRFGLVSIRECFRDAYGKPGGISWIRELIWRDFNFMILSHFPNTAYEEFQPKYRNILKWTQNNEFLEKFKQGLTGFPVVDAAIRQLITTNWMHNRARMIVASFMTKHLLIDWRIGEKFFAEYLMDYDLAANVGGWQWSSSVGTDAQPYFRIFNPYLQSKKFDNDGTYIRTYVKELAHLPASQIHTPPELLRGTYPPPIVDHEQARLKAIALFKNIA